MLILKLWSNLTGYVIIRVKGQGLEKFVNIASSRGIRIWAIRRAAADMLYASTTVRGFRALRPLARRLRCELRIRRRCGLPFLLKSLERRKVLAAGVFLFLSALWVLSSFVWFIQIDGAQRVDQRLVRAKLATLGLKEGSLSRNIDAVALEKALIREFPDLAWAGVRVRGTLVRVEVVEKIPLESQRSRPANVVSRRDGVVTSVVTVSGQPLVHEGETVLAGQVLISGVVPLYQVKVIEAEPASKRSPEKKLEPVTYTGLLGTSGDLGYLCAQGTVRAKVWFEAVRRVPFAGVEWLPTGRSRGATVVVLGGRKLWLGPRTAPYDRYTLAERRQRLALDRKNRLAVEVIQLSYRELSRVTHHIGVEAARQRAVALAQAAVEKEVGRETRVLGRQVSLTEDGDSVTARVMLECEEEIQVSRPVRVGDPAPAASSP